MFSAPETKVAPGAAAWALRIAGALLVTGGVGAAEAGAWVAELLRIGERQMPSRPSLMAKIVDTRANMPAMPAISQRTVCTAESARTADRAAGWCCWWSCVAGEKWVPGILGGWPDRVCNIPPHRGLLAQVLNRP
jgi:hypothetical protein